MGSGWFEMTTAVIVQARLSSSRLPGKVMQDVAGQPLLGHVLDRCLAIPGVDVVVCATVSGTEGDPIETCSAGKGVLTYRGPRDDVLERYRGASRSVGAKVVMRVTSDCPLIDPRLCGRVLRLREETGADFACNNEPPSFPHGLDCEDRDHREHLGFVRQMMEWLPEGPSVPNGDQRSTPCELRAGVTI